MLKKSIRFTSWPGCRGRIEGAYANCLLYDHAVYRGDFITVTSRAAEGWDREGPKGRRERALIGM